MTRQFQLTAASVTGTCFWPLTQMRAILDQPPMRTVRLIRPAQPDEITGVGVALGVGDKVAVGSGVAVGEAVGVAVGVGVKVAPGTGVGLAVAVGVEVGGAAWLSSKSTSAMVLAARFKRKVVFNPCGVIR